MAGGARIIEEYLQGLIECCVDPLSQEGFAASAWIGSKACSCQQSAAPNSKVKDTKSFDGKISGCREIVRMDLMAFVLSVALFIYFWVVGYVVVFALSTRRDLVRNALMAPAVGVVATIYPIYVLSRVGLPVGTFAHALTGVAIILATLGWAWWRPLVPGRHLLPYVFIAMFAFATTGWPLLTIGFGWFGAVNPDMTNYVLDAHRFVDQPFVRLPDPHVWLSQSDWAGYYVVYPAFGVRSASDLLLAWVIALTGENGAMIYMSLMVALHVSLIFVATALISTPHRLARLLAATLMSSAAMITLGVVLQLLGQVLGLLLLTLGCVLYLSPFYRLGRNALIRFGVFASAVLAVFVLSYPEALPFLALAFVVYHCVGARDIRPFVARGILALFVVGIFAIVLMAPDAVAVLSFMFRQAQASTAIMRLTELFPFFLVPSGLASLWGLNPYYADGGILLPLGILCGLALTIFAAGSAIWLAWRQEPAAALIIVMVALGAVLFAQNAGFGTFKLAMYIQPFLLTTTVLSACLLLRISTKRTARALLLVAVVAGLVAGNLRTQVTHIDSTLPQSVGLKTAITRLQQLAQTPANTPVLLDTTEFGQTALMASFTRGRTTASVSGEAAWSRVLGFVGGVSPLFADDVRKEVFRLQDATLSLQQSLQFELGKNAPVHRFGRVKMLDEISTADPVLLAPAADQSIVNNGHKRPQTGRYYLVPVADVRNYLGLVDSSLGRPVIPGVVENVALWQRERDFAGSGGMQAIGRHVLFEVFNVRPGSRLLLEFSRGPLGADGQSLPPAEVIGANRSEMGFVGYGAARMLSPPITARTIDGRAYVAVDMGVAPQRMRTFRRGLANLYNRHLSLDPRSIVGWTRNISLLTEEEVGALTPPAGIDRFPAGLFHQGLLFTGLAEDGWMTAIARMRLGASDARTIRVIGSVPNVSGLASGLTIELTVDGRSVARQTVAPGDFEVRAAMPAGSGPRWIELHADRSARLTPPDGRLVSMLLKSIKLEN